MTLSMNQRDRHRALATAMKAAADAGRLMRRSVANPKTVHRTTRHDIKLELDVRCQARIERHLLSAFPQAALLGEEGVAGNPASPLRWVVDPIDGTVNFAYGIPHACVSIALQVRRDLPGAVAGTQGRVGRGHHKDPSVLAWPDGFETVVGVVYDPFRDELWTALRGGPARLNGRRISVSNRRRLGETMLSIGFGKQTAVLDDMVSAFRRLAHQVRKVRIMGSAALDLAYVASGRLDAYVEPRLRLWDVAAGGLLVDCAGGEFWCQPAAGRHACQVIATNGHLRPKLQRRLGHFPP